MSRTKINTWPKLFRSLLTISILLSVLVSSWLFYNTRAHKAKDINYTLNYKVVAGTTFNAVLKDLYVSDIIRSYYAAKLLQSVFGLTLKQGTYDISPNMTTWEILSILQKGAEPLVKITFPEGFSINDMAKRLQSQGFINAYDFVQKTKDKQLLFKLDILADSAEGYLFPSTYYVPLHISSQELITLMVNTFKEKIKLFTSNISSQEVYDRIILASIIEKEAVTNNDRPLIASVFFNRIKQNMKLESCATVIYIFDQQGIKKNRVYFKDLKVESPFNTYIHTGLPPAPISNPSLLSLEAAFKPATTPYLFFAYKGNGEHIFSENYKDHMEAYNKYIKYQLVNKS